MDSSEEGSGFVVEGLVGFRQGNQRLGLIAEGVGFADYIGIELMGMLPGLCGVVQGILVVRRGNEAVFRFIPPFPTNNQEVLCPALVS